MPKTKKINKEKISKNESEYKLILKFNDEVYELETNNLSNSIMEIKPIILKTRIIVEVEKNGKKFNKTVFVPRGRMIFKNKTWLEVFIKQIKMIIG